MNGIDIERRFDVNNYDAIRELTAGLKNHRDPNPKSIKTLEEVLGTIRVNSFVLATSLNDDLYVYPTLQIFRQLQSVDFHGRFQNDQVQEARELGCSLVSDNIASIDRALGRLPDSRSLQLAVDAVCSVAREEMLSADGREMDFLINHFEEGLRTDNQAARGKNHYTKYSWIAISMFLNMETVQRERMIEILQRVVVNPEIRGRALYVVSQLAGQVHFSDEVQAEIRARLVKPLVESFGLNYDALLKIWATGSDEISGNLYYNRSNLEDILNLESVRPGICRVLFNEFGIGNFHRYHQELLIDLYDQRDNQTIPYGLMIYPKRDHSGAFYKTREATGRFYRQLKSLGYSLRLFEVDGKYELARVFVGSKRRYGTGNKVAFVILAGHGTPNAITFGETQKGEGEQINTINARSTLSKIDFEGRGAQRVGTLLADDANIILLSCSTGAEEGIAGIISQAYSKTLVTAPAVRIRLEALEVSRDAHGKLHFKVLYSKLSATRTFAGGNPV